MEFTNVVGVASIVVQLIFLEGILSIDNAAVLGALVSVLPRNQPVPFPGPLRFMQRFTDRVLGMQQMAALKVGLLGAYAGRALMLLLASWVIENQFLKVVGALYLIKLAFEQLSKESADNNDKDATRAKIAAGAFWVVVLQVELADLAFSLDNVVAAVALSDKLWVVLLGVALGILTMRFAAGIFTMMIRHEPILAIAAYVVVFNIGVELLLAEYLNLHFDSWQKFVISAGTIVLAVVYARVKFLRVLGPFFRWIGAGMGIVDELVNWALQPFATVIKKIFTVAWQVVVPLLHRQTPPISPAGQGDWPDAIPVKSDVVD